MFAGLHLAVGLLTVIPVRPPQDVGRVTARNAMLVAPLAVLPVSLGAALAGWGALLVGLPNTLAGVVVIALMVLGTRAMHADGLADTVDGLGSWRGRERALEIMRTGDVGPMGVTALVLAYLAQVLAASVLLGREWGWLQLAVLIALSRAALLFGCVRGVPAARPDGLGALVASSVPAAATVVVWMAVGGIGVGLASLVGQSLWLPMIGLLVVVWVSSALVGLVVRRLGGITGDVLGALVEVASTLLLVVASVR